MALIIENALLVDLDPLRAEMGSLRIEGGRIIARGAVDRRVGDEAIDCAGAVVLPGLVNGHTHLYSALAAGMPAPPRTPSNFHEILQFVWWRLDRALDAESIEMSALIGGIEALRCGTTTLIDHHASPSCIAGSLDMVERGLSRVGVRGVLCYETTDRNGVVGRDAGVAENRRYLEKCAANGAGRYAGLVGAHASFTCGDAAMEACSDLACEFDTGVHIHAAEDPVDEELCRRDHGMALIDRLEKFGLLSPHSIFAHGTHLGGEALARINDTGVSLAHNPRSNMNNAVGYTPIGEVNAPLRLLGTDGIGADMFAEAQAAWMKSRDGGAGISPGDVLAMLAANARRASQSLGATVGRLEPGAEADIIITDYAPATPLNSDNVAGHFIFAMSSRHVRDVLVAGEWKLRDRRVQALDEHDCRAQSRGVAGAMWKRMQGME